MEMTATAIPDVLLITPKVHADERGFFYESFNQRTFHQLSGLNVSFVQENHSKSTLGVLRGLHYQNAPQAQAKLVRVVQGVVFDVAVDIRKGSATLGQWVGYELSAENKQQLWIPEGFAHGFLVLSETAELVYQGTSHYCAEAEMTIAWNDPDSGVDWGLKQEPLLSDKDRLGVGFKKNLVKTD